MFFFFLYIIVIILRPCLCCFEQGGKLKLGGYKVFKNAKSNTGDWCIYSTCHDMRLFKVYNAETELKYIDETSETKK